MGKCITFAWELGQKWVRTRNTSCIGFRTKQQHLVYMYIRTDQTFILSRHPTDRWSQTEPNTLSSCLHFTYNAINLKKLLPVHSMEFVILKIVSAVVFGFRISTFLLGEMYKIGAETILKYYVTIKISF